jgi:hypothetical protein
LDDDLETTPLRTKRDKPIESRLTAQDQTIDKSTIAWYQILCPVTPMKHRYHVGRKLQLIIDTLVDDPQAPVKKFKLPICPVYEAKKRIFN